MKYSIATFILILFTCKSYGQWDNFTIAVVPRYDTVRCIMLISDTSDHMGIPGEPIARDYFGNAVPQKNYKVQWYYGYEVVGYNHREYLDQYKKKLNAAAVVWQSINIK